MPVDDRTVVLAREVQQRVLGIISKGLFPSEMSPFLDQVLGYADQTKTHRLVMISILAMANWSAISEDLRYVTNTSPLVDIVKGSSETYYYAARFMEFFSPWIAENSELSIGIQQGHYRINDGWIFSYAFSAPSATAPQNIASSMLQPERQMLLNFWFSPVKLEGAKVDQYLPVPKIVRSHLSYAGEFEYFGLRHFDFIHDAIGQANDGSMMSYPGSRGIAYRKYLSDKGKIKFSVVEIGTVMIGGKLHWVYTGSEKTERL